jgi:hypothetical protein
MTTVHVMVDHSAKDDKSGRDSLDATPLLGDNNGGSFRTPRLGSSSGSVATPACRLSIIWCDGCDHRVTRVAMLASLPPAISSPLLFFLPAATRHRLSCPSHILERDEEREERGGKEKKKDPHIFLLFTFIFGVTLVPCQLKQLTIWQYQFYKLGDML